MKIITIILAILAISFYYFCNKQYGLEDIILKNSHDLNTLSMKIKKFEKASEIKKGTNTNNPHLSNPHENISGKSSEVKDQIDSISKEITIITREIEILKSYFKKKKNLNNLRKNEWRKIALGMNEFQVKNTW